MNERNEQGSKPLRSVADQQILSAADRILPGATLLILTNGTALATHLIKTATGCSWDVFTFEHFYLTNLAESLGEATADGGENVELYCMPDLPEQEYQTIVLPMSFRNSSELARDLLQQCRNRLHPNGRLITSTDNPRDHWLHAYLKEHFGKTTVLKGEKGISYVSTRGGGENKQKDFDSEFAFRADEKLIKCISRPGVFSHRRIDAGARALIRSLDLLPEGFGPRKIIDMGTGCGAVATAAALRFPDSEVLAVDSHVRAVQSAERTAALNELQNVQVMLTADGILPADGEWDLFLCNPPYYSDYRISELFLQAAVDSVREGGLIHVVTKLTDWHENRMIEVFANADLHEIGEYGVVISEVLPY